MPESKQHGRRPKGEKMKKLQGYLTGGGVATMQLFAVLLLFMVAPYGANASG